MTGVGKREETYLICRFLRHKRDFPHTLLNTPDEQNESDHFSFPPAGRLPSEPSNLLPFSNYGRQPGSNYCREMIMTDND